MGSGIRVVGGTPPADDAGAVRADDAPRLAEDAPRLAEDGRRRRRNEHGRRRRAADLSRPAAGAADTGAGRDAAGALGAPPRRRRGAAFVAACVLAALGIAGTIVFGTAWAGLHGTQAGEAQASAKARTFLVDLTNFDAKTVDADFAAITSMATGPFAGQADKFFNSSIRQELQRALASSRGQVRELYVQSYGGTRASVYAVVTQLYSNNKVTSPQTDVLRIVLTMQQVGGAWKVADVTVLTGPSQGTAPTTPGAAGASPSGSSAGASPSGSSAGASPSAG